MKNKVYILVCDEYNKSVEEKTNLGVYRNVDDALKAFNEIKDDFISANPDNFENEEEYEVTEKPDFYHWMDEGMGYYFELWIEEHEVK